MKRMAVVVIAIALLSGCASMRARNMTDEQIKNQQAILSGAGYGVGVCYAYNLDTREAQVAAADRIYTVAEKLTLGASFAPSDEALIQAVVAGVDGDLRMAAEVAVGILAQGSMSEEDRKWLGWFVRGIYHGMAAAIGPAPGKAMPIFSPFKSTTLDTIPDPMIIDDLPTDGTFFIIGGTLVPVEPTYQIDENGNVTIPATPPVVRKEQ